MIFSVANKKVELVKIIRNGIVLVLIFGIALIVINLFSAKQKIIECAICNEGIRRLRYNEFDYGLILAICAVLSIIPSLIRIIKNQKKASAQQ